MSWVVRPARADDLDAMYGLAMMTGGGFTNLPQDRDALAARLARSEAAYAREVEAPDNELYLLVLEHRPTGRIGGTALVYSRIGVEWPFYSYKITNLQQYSKELGKTFSIQSLTLCSDHDGASEVGGLFLHPELRTGGLGRLLARSRYLFIALHRRRFGERLLAELRGVIEEDGGSPFWDGLGRAFFGMSFQEADRFNALNGNQFIADLMPKHPVYVALLPEAARKVIGQPHPSGTAAMRMLEAEGFSFDGYVDIFDGGPTMTARTDNVRTVRTASAAVVTGLVPGCDGMVRSLVACGRLKAFRAWMGHAGDADGGLILPRGEAEAAQVGIGDEVWHVGF